MTRARRAAARLCAVCLLLTGSTSNRTGQAGAVARDHEKLSKGSPDRAALLTTGVFPLMWTARDLQDSIARRNVTFPLPPSQLPCHTRIVVMGTGRESTITAQNSTSYAEVRRATVAPEPFRHENEVHRHRVHADFERVSRDIRLCQAGHRSNLGGESRPELGRSTLNLLRLSDAGLAQGSH